MSQQLTEEELAHLLPMAQGGDRMAIGAMLRSVDGLLKHLMRGSKASSMPEDKLQEGRIAALEAIHHWNPTKSSFPWLVGLMASQRWQKWQHDMKLVRTCRSLATAQKKYKENGNMSTAPDQVGAQCLDELTVEAQVHINEAKEVELHRTLQLRGAIQRLPDTLRRIIEALTYEGKVLREVAEEEGVTHQCIHQWRQKAIEMLRQRMEVEGRGVAA